MRQNSLQMQLEPLHDPSAYCLLPVGASKLATGSPGETGSLACAAAGRPHRYGAQCII